MPDSFTEYSHRGFGSRIKNSIAGAAIGGLMFLGSFALLAWNEGRAIKETHSLEEGKKLVVTIDPANPSPQTEGMLVFATGKAMTDDEITDDEFGVTEQALRLDRKVEMYQWDEDKDSHEDSHGNSKTTYNYKKIWNEGVISSSGFHYPSGHENPRSIPFNSKSYQATSVTVGTHLLSQSLLSQIKSSVPLTVSKDIVDDAPANGSVEAKLNGGGLYYGKNPSDPAVGDVRVSFQVTLPQDISFAAKQVGKTFAPFPTKAGNEINLLEEGRHDAEYVFNQALSRNTALTFVLRFAGWFLMFIGLLLVMGPLTTLTGVLPIVGSVVGLGVASSAFVLASVLSTVTVAISWIVVRPLAGIALLGICGLVIWKAKNRGEKKIAQLSGPPPAEPPPPPPPPPPAGA